MIINRINNNDGSITLFCESNGGVKVAVTAPTEREARVKLRKGTRLAWVVSAYLLIEDTIEILRIYGWADAICLIAIVFIPRPVGSFIVMFYILYSLWKYRKEIKASFFTLKHSGK